MPSEIMNNRALQDIIAPDGIRNIFTTDYVTNNP